MATFKTICKAAILVMAGLLLLAPLFPAVSGPVLLVAGAVILASALACMADSYKKPVCLFLLLSALIAWQFQLPLGVPAAGIRSMLPIVAIVAVLQIFVIPLAAGRYDRFLKQYVQGRFKSGGSLYLFLLVLTNLLGALLSLGAVPLVFSIFRGGVKDRVEDYERFIVTAVSRGFAMATVWAPGMASVILAMQATGAQWLDIFTVNFWLGLVGIATAVMMEKKAHMSADSGGPAAVAQGAGSDAGGVEQTKNVGVLLAVAAAMVVLIAVMEQARVLTNSTRILAACLIVAFLWTACYFRRPELKPAWQGFWGKALDTMPGLAALFISMGIFSETVDQSGMLTGLLAGLTGEISALGKYILFFVPPLLLLMSCTGIHPFVSLMILGKILNAALSIPHQVMLIPFALLLGGALSYVASPFTGTILILSGLTGSRASEVAFRWNGPFAAVFLLEGLAALFVLELFL